MIECEHSIYPVGSGSGHISTFSHRGEELDFISGSLASQISDLSSSFGESVSVYDNDDCSEKDYLGDMVFDSAGLEDVYDYSDVEIFDFSDTELEASSDPDFGCVLETPR